MKRFEWALGGGKVDSRNPLPPIVNDFQLAKEFGWSWQQIQETPAVVCDWFLALARTQRSAVNVA